MYKLSDSELQDIQRGLLELLKVFKSICEEENIWYSLAFGSVLGAVRHKGFIPWDSDADVYIQLSDNDKFRKAFYKCNPQGIVLNNYNEDKHNTKSHDTLRFESEQSFSDLHLDIYPLIGAPNDIRKHKRVAKMNSLLDRIFRSKYVNLNDCLEENRKKVFFVKLIDKLIPDSIIKSNIKYRERKYDVNDTDYWTSLVSRYTIPKKCFDRLVMMRFEDTEFYVPGDWDLYLKTIYGDYMTPRKH